MNEEKQNQTYFKEAFHEVHAPRRLAERVMNVEELKRKKKAGSAAKWLAVAAVAAVVLFAGSNVVAYATTGNTWVETLVYKITVGGAEYDVEMEAQQKQNGDIYYSGSIDHGNGDVSEVKYEKINDRLSSLSVSTEFSGYLKVRDDRAYIMDDGIEIDVTDEVLKNGQAVGTYEVNGFTKEYKVWKSGEYYHHEIKTIYDGMEEDEWWNFGQSVEFFADPTPTPQP